MTFLYPFLNFLQPGILWPALSAARPMLLMSTLALLTASTRHADARLRARMLGHPALLWLYVFVLVQIVSVHYSGWASMLEELGFWYVYPCFVACSLLLITDAQALRRYVWGMIFGCAAVIGYGLYAVAAHLPTLAGGRAGAYGMYENHNDYTFLIIQLLPFLFAYLRLYRSTLIRSGLLVLVVACVAGVLLSLSRGGILALVLEAALLAATLLRGGKRTGTFVLVAVLGTAAIVHQFEAREANQAGNYTEADAKASRYELWRAAGSMIVAHPALGVGSRRFHEFSQDYGEISHDNRGKVAHNTFMEVAADTGLLGLGAFLSMIGAVLRATGRGRAHPAPDGTLRELSLAAGIALLAILFRSLLDAKAHDWSFYALAVIAIAASTLPGSRSLAHQERLPVSPSPARMPRPPRAVRPVVHHARVLSSRWRGRPESTSRR